MKVDKAVCTNDTLVDLTKAIKYEAVFTTLVENKILAIKRESEEKKKAKRQKRKTFGRLLFGRKIFGGNGSSSKKSSGDVGSMEIEKGESTSEIFSKVQSEIRPSSSLCKNRTSKNDSETNGLASPIVFSTYGEKIQNIESEEPKDDSNGSNGNTSPTERTAHDLIVEVITHRDDHSYDDIEKFEINDDNDKINSTVLNLIEENRSTTIADETLTSGKESSESLSFPSSHCTISAGLGTGLSYEKEHNRLRLLEAKSISAQCSPIFPRQKRPLYHAQKQKQTHTNIKDDHFKQQPQLPRQVSYNTDEDQHDLNNALRFFSRQNTSEDSANLTISTLLHEADSAMFNIHGERKSKSTSVLVITDKDNNKANNCLDSNSIVSYQSNPQARVLVSSFNQLISSSSYFPAITTTISTFPTTLPAVSTTTPLAITTMPTSTKSELQESQPALISTMTTASFNDAKLQRMASTSTGSSVVPTGCCTTGKSYSKDKEKRPKASWENGQSGSDDEYRKRKRKYKRYHRCSDPVLVYPSSGGLQHCILSMPPNQPIQFHYNDDFVYDMTLQVEADKNGDLQAIVPSHRSNRHRHHRHKKRHRHKKPKILVHDLDTQSVKVIDPDDLPQRARWTIIATACLLLVMCLMLVGITLRMAPIIDDMVRQENERLMQESMNRGRFVKNFTEAAQQQQHQQQQASEGEIP